MIAWLIDTGPIVAYLDARDSEHARVAEVLDVFSGELASTSAVVTECMHFVGESPGGPALLAEFVVASGLQVYDLTQPSMLGDAAALMEKYRDTPMDFADATLVLLAEELGVLDIATLDRRGFWIYRTRRKNALRLVLDIERYG